MKFKGRELIFTGGFAGMKSSQQELDAQKFKKQVAKANLIGTLEAYVRQLQEWMAKYGDGGSDELRAIERCHALERMLKQPALAADEASQWDDKDSRWQWWLQDQ